jgi:hypothetical protein
MVTYCSGRCQEGKLDLIYFNEKGLDKKGWFLGFVERRVPRGLKCQKLLGRLTMWVGYVICNTFAIMV